MSDVEELIGQTLQDSGLAEMSDMGELVGTSESDVQDRPQGQEAPESEPVEQAAAPAETPAEGAEKPEEKKPEPEGDELDKELQQHGLRSKDDLGRDTRIRYPRVRKIVENMREKLTKELTGKHTEELTTLKQQLEQVGPAFQNYRAAEQLLETNPQRYFMAIAQANPALKQFLHPSLFGEQVPQQQQQKAVPADQDPRPQPDASFADGSKGYSPEGLEKLEAWNRRQTLREAEALMEQRFGKPIQQLNEERRTAAEQKMQVETVQNNIRLAVQAYGKVFSDDFGQFGAIKPTSEVMKVLTQNPGMPFLQACAIALVPKIQGDRNKMREDLIKELDTAGKNRQAAGRPAPASSQAPSKAALSQEELIFNSMQQAGLIP